MAGCFSGRGPEHGPLPLPRMHPQFSPMMQPPCTGSTGVAPGPWGSGEANCPDCSAIAAASGIDIPLGAAVCTPQPIATTNAAAQQRDAITVIPLLITTPNVDSLGDRRISKTSTA